MLPYVEIAKAGWEILQRAIKLGQQIKEKFSPHVVGETTDQLFVPGTTTIVERFLQGTFPFIQGRYNIEYEDRKVTIITRHVENELCPWEFQIEPDITWWKLPNATIKAIKWIELLEITRTTNEHSK